MDYFGRLLKQANNNMMRHFDQFARQYDLTGNQMAIIDFISNDSSLTTDGEKRPYRTTYLIERR